MVGTTDGVYESYAAIEMDDAIIAETFVAAGGAAPGAERCDAGDPRRFPARSAYPTLREEREGWGTRQMTGEFRDSRFE